MEKETKQILDYMSLLSSPGFYSIFGGMVQDMQPKSPFENLGDGYELRPIELSKKEQENSRIVELKYSHLYHNGLKVSDEIFRKGGMGGKYKDGYCELIHYTRTKEKEKNDYGFSFGTFVIINHLGEISLQGGRFSSDHPHHIGGHLASIGHSIYDLRTGKIIAVKSSTTMVGESSIIIEHRYDWYDKEKILPLGIYQINFHTAMITKIDNVKR